METETDKFSSADSTQIVSQAFSKQLFQFYKIPDKYAIILAEGIKII